MQELKYEVRDLCIRGDLNMMFTISRSIVTILQLADNVPIAGKTLVNLSEDLLCLAAEVHGRILRDYGDDFTVPSAASKGND